MKKHRKNVELAMDIVQRSHRYRLTIYDLARQVGLSETNLKNSFRDEFNISIHAFILQQRILSAESMLLYSGKTVTQVASQCGFRHLSNLNKSFKKKNSVPPAAWRKKMKQEMRRQK